MPERLNKEEVKLCINCRYMRAQVPGDAPRCSLFPNYMAPVLGYDKYETMASCAVERADPSTCGPEGRRWEPKYA